MQTVIASAFFFETIPPMRSRISEAALLVKVTARMFSGAIPTCSMFEIRQVTVRVLPVPAPARIRTGPSSEATASRWALLRESNEKPPAMRGRMEAVPEAVGKPGTELIHRER